MLTGTVSQDLQAWVTIELIGPSGHPFPIKTVLDTGFNGELALPAATIMLLGLPEDTRRPAVIATGERVILMTYRGTVVWYGRPLSIQVVEADSEPLLGMELLLDSRVVLDVRDGGPVTIDGLP